MSELLSVSNISISFTQYIQGLNQRKLHVISDLSLEINEGEVVAVLGSSGSGKSLLAHAILGILPHNANLSGDIKYEGEILTQDLKEKLRGNEISLVPQSVNFLDPLMRVADQAIGECQNDEEKKQKKIKQREVFDKFGLDESVDDMYPFQLSGGMARRVLISTALLRDSKLIIADEPTPGLDTVARNETLEFIRNLSKEGVGILLITHDIDAALEVADKIAIFYAGYVIEIADVADFTNHGEKLSHPYTKALYRALPDVDFKFIEGTQPLQDEVTDLCPFSDRCPFPLEKCFNTVPKLVDYKDKKLRCFRCEDGTLEEVSAPLNKVNSSGDGFVSLESVDGSSDDGFDSLESVGGSSDDVVDIVEDSIDTEETNE